MIHEKGASLNNRWGFIDGTVRGVCRTQENQCIIYNYNGHNQVYSRTLQSLVTPNGLIARLVGPYDGKKHDSRMLADSGLLEFLAITFFAS